MRESLHRSCQELCNATPSNWPSHQVKSPASPQNPTPEKGPKSKSKTSKLQNCEIWVVEEGGERCRLYMGVVLPPWLALLSETTACNSSRHGFLSLSLSLISLFLSPFGVFKENKKKKKGVDFSVTGAKQQMDFDGHNTQTQREREAMMMMMMMDSLLLLFLYGFRIFDFIKSGQKSKNLWIF